MFNLADLLPARFMETHWERGPLFASRQEPAPGLEALRERFPPLAEHYIACYREQIKVFSPGAEVERKFVAPSDALEYLSTSSTLYLVNYHRYDKCCADLLDTLSRRFGLHQGRASVFISSGHAYMPFHWDSLNNLTWQLQGTKQWFLAPNTQMPFPLQNHAANRPPAPELERLLNGRHILPPSRRTIEKVTVTESSLLYVPRGHWHATRTRGSSISLSLNFEPTALADYLAEKIREQLRGHASLRANLQGRSPETAAAWTSTCLGAMSDLIGVLAQEVEHRLSEQATVSTGTSEIAEDVQ